MAQQNFIIGQLVRNFGLTAIVDSFHPVTGDLVLRDANGIKWIADPAKCEAVDTPSRHRDGLVVFG